MQRISHLSSSLCHYSHTLLITVYAVRIIQLQGYLAHKKMPLTRTLQEAYAYDPMEVLGVECFVMSEITLYASSTAASWVSGL
jgi:hypothetical protein